MPRETGKRKSHKPMHMHTPPFRTKRCPCFTCNPTTCPLPLVPDVASEMATGDLAGGDRGRGGDGGPVREGGGHCAEGPAVARRD